MAACTGVGGRVISDVPQECRSIDPVETPTLHESRLCGKLSRYGSVRRSGFAYLPGDVSMFQGPYTVLWYKVDTVRDKSDRNLRLRTTIDEHLPV